MSDPQATGSRPASLADLLEIARQIRQIAEMDEAWPVDNFAMACCAIRVLYGEAEMTRLIDEAFAKGREDD